MGDSVVTCNQLYYESYKYTVRPKCEVGDSGSDVVTGNMKYCAIFMHIQLNHHIASFNLRSFFIWLKLLSLSMHRMNT